MENIKVEGYWFDSDADNRCETNFILLKIISAL